MSRTIRTAAFKKKIALEALREHKTATELASQYGVHPIQIAKWKKELIEGAESIFQDKRKLKKSEDIDQEMLERKIGRLTIELDFLKKKLGY